MKRKEFVVIGMGQFGSNVAKTLASSGAMVMIIDKNEQALEMVANHPEDYYDIIFMDVQMPRLNGYDAAREIRHKRREYYRRVPIIAMTANAFADDVKEAIGTGMNEHIAKPLDWKALARVLQKWVK